MISIIIPAHNEEENISQLLDDLIKLKFKKEIIVVSDHSTDKTNEIVRKYKRKNKNIILFDRKTGDKGMGFTLIDGTNKARGDIIVWTMGDKSDDLNTIYKMIDKINFGSDVVFASRYMEGGSIGDNSKLKALMSGGYSFVANLIFRMGVHDIGNAFRAFKKEVFDSVELERGDFSISPELAIKAHLAGFKLGEVPTSYTKRKKGTSQFKLIKMGWEDIKLFKYLFVNPKH